ncbi:MAG: phosphotransferase [Chloroflexi bacterium]|nr:phosphotransferase [Chloroflexota bacterium]MBK7918953.1 phosphotransferase [Chloroflexota bacterium]
MGQSQVDVAQLQKRDPAAWTELLRLDLEDESVRVTAVTAEPIRISKTGPYRRSVSRYILTLEGCSDPITFIGKLTNREETLFYEELSVHLPTLAPRCLYTHLNEESQQDRYGWVVLEDAPNDYTAVAWTPNDAEALVEQLAALHSFFWQRGDDLHNLGIPHFIEGKTYSWNDLRRDRAVYFEQGPAAILSQHAIRNAGRLAPTLLEAANGLTVIRSLDGWPGILGESHMQAVADLLDDPVPMLEPLKHLPPTLFHGNPHSHHWHISLLGDYRLLDWHDLRIGPGLFDLVSFMEQFDLLYENDSRSQIVVRPERPITDETIIDSYLLTMSARLGAEFDARAVRMAIPAARCLYVLSSWLPHFATWFSEMPNKYTWQKINHMSDEQLTGTAFHSIIQFRPYLSGVFDRFLQAHKTL